MTIPRTPGTVEALLLDTVHKLSPEAILSYTGKSQAHFYKVSHPDSRWVLSIEDAAGLDAALINAGHPPRFIGLMEQLTAAKANGSTPGVCIVRALRSLAVESGELNRVVDRAMEDGTLTGDERHQIAGQAQRVGDTAYQIRDEVEPPYCGPAEVA